MNLKEIEQLTKTVLREAEIDTSSDFVCAAYQINSRTCPKFATRVEPVLSLEVPNYHPTWVENVCFIEALLVGSNAETYRKAMEGYRACLDFLLLNDDVETVFPMDDKDHIGWQIHKELQAKYTHCKTFYERLNYVETKSR